jgi:hypothetical protein
MDDFEKGAACGAFLPALAYASLWALYGRPSNEIVWYGAIGLCAAIGGGVNLWRKSVRGVKLDDRVAPGHEALFSPREHG